MAAKAVANRGSRVQGPSPDNRRRVRPETRLQHRRSIGRAIEAMKNRLDTTFRLEEMAEVAVMSPFHFNRVFRDVTGIPPHRFLAALRLSAAKRLLLSSDLSVTDVSLEVGYNSLGTFTRRFSELVGAAPVHYRELALAGAAEGLRHLSSAPAEPERSRGAPGLWARLAASEEGQGPVFVALFGDAVPQGEPHACAILNGPGRFHLRAVPDGTYFLLAVGLGCSADHRQALLHDDDPRGGLAGRAVTVRNGRPSEEEPTVRLRPAEATDPPIVASLPLLLARRPGIGEPARRVFPIGSG